VVSAIPVLAVLVAPIALGLPRIYVWAAPAPDLPEHALELLRHKRPYLNGPFFVVRAALYFVIWSAAGWVLCRGSLAQDRAAGPRAAASGETARRASAGLLPFVALGLTFAAFDWLMSLQPLWFSSIFGVYYFAGGFVASFGLLALLAFVSERSGMTPGVIRPPHFHALGRLMFGFSIFWAYNAFFQFMLIQIANRPEEVEFYVHRMAHGWDVVAALLVVARFLVPFALLLPRAIKFRGSILACVGVLLVVGHYVDMYWLVVPMHRAQSAFPTIWEPCALAAVAGTAVAYAVIRQRGRPVVPIGDPLLPESIEYRSPT
jgi:hypothetical protein